jgi:transposase-like protein
MQGTNPREEKGKKIVEAGDQIRRIDANHYQVKSQSHTKWYDVISTESGWKCSCPDSTFRKVCCKHTHAVEFSLTIRNEVTKIIIKPFSNLNCPSCNSENIIKRGIRKNKAGDIQRFYCNDCAKWFVFNLGFEKMRASPQVITSTLQLYFSGESLRNVHHFLKLQGVEVSHMSVYRWIKKYVELMESYLNKIQPQVGEKWRADELYLKIKGNTKYLYALMDDETRYWIATQVADSKYREDVRPLLAQGRNHAGKRPLMFITDGAPNFHLAYKKEFWTNKSPQTKHCQNIRLQGDIDNNKMERMNGEIRDREKTMRGLKKMDTPIITGFQIYHNYMKNHMSLEGKTPSEMAGIKIEGDNKWITLIQNASKEAKKA